MKKIFGVTLITCMLACLTACNNNENNDTQNEVSVSHSDNFIGIVVNKNTDSNSDKDIGDIISNNNKNDDSSDAPLSTVVISDISNYEKYKASENIATEFKVQDSIVDKASEFGSNAQVYLNTIVDICNIKSIDTNEIYITGEDSYSEDYKYTIINMASNKYIIKVGFDSYMKDIIYLVEDIE